MIFLMLFQDITLLVSFFFILPFVLLIVCKKCVATCNPLINELAYYVD
uniref:Uncharacterized protein n=1 Tax=Rhizophora mucronata TaxID=61149 RepID=A0A2P2PER0_RHIMU